MQKRQICVLCIILCCATGKAQDNFSGTRSSDEVGFIQSRLEDEVGFIQSRLEVSFEPLESIARRRRRRRTPARRRRDHKPCSGCKPACFPGSEGVYVSGGAHRFVSMKDLKVGDKIEVYPVTAEKGKPHLSGDGTSVPSEVLGWGTLREKETTMFLELRTASESVRVTGDHFVVTKRTLDSEQQVMKASDVKMGYYLPVVSRGKLEWHPIIDSSIVKDTGLYVPLLGQVGDVITKHGIVVPLLSQGHDLRTNDETSDLSPQEAYQVYSSWVKHYISLRMEYPCLVKFDEDYKQSVVTEMMKQYFAKHHHDVADALDSAHFLEWLRKDPNAVVGAEFAPHLKKTCPDLFAKK